MSDKKIEFKNGTYIKTRGPWNVNVSARAICPDGKARVVSRIGLVADSMFSVPAGMRIKGVYYSGFVWVSEIGEKAGTLLFSANAEQKRRKKG